MQSLRQSSFFIVCQERRNDPILNLSQFDADSRSSSPMRLRGRQLPKTWISWKDIEMGGDLIQPVRQYGRIFKQLIEEEHDFEKHSKDFIQTRKIQVIFDQIAKRAIFKWSIFLIG
jgi:hypothetical protein